MNEIIVLNKNAKIKIKFWHLFLFNFIFLLLCYFPNLQMRFSADSYFKINPMNNIHFLLNDGRLCNYIVAYIQKIFHLNAVLNQQFFLLIYLVIISLCICYLLYMYNELTKDDFNIIQLLSLNLIFAFGFVNVLLNEFNGFPEVIFCFGLGILCIVRALKDYFIRRNYLQSFVFLTCALNFYQMNIQIWVMLFLCFLLLYSNYDLNRKFWIETFRFILLSSSALISTVLILNILQKLGIAMNCRSIVFSSVVPNVNHIISDFKFYIKHPLDSIGGVILYQNILILLLSLIFEKQMNKFFYAILLFLISLIIFFGIHIFLTIWPVPRTLIGFGFLITSLSLLIYKNVNPKKMFGLLFALFIFNVFFVQSISINQYASNRLDQEYVQNICYRIFDYEKQNKVEIRKIAICNDKNIKYTYDGIKYYSAYINDRVLIYGHANLEIINYYSHRNFEKVDMPKEIYEKYFADKNWDYYKPEEQLIFFDDTLYICVY